MAYSRPSSAAVLEPTLECRAHDLALGRACGRHRGRSTAEGQPLPHEDAIAATHHQYAIAATRVPAQPSKKQLEDAAEAARVAALAAAALERRNAPPVSKLEALALRVEERPDRLRSRLRLKARSASEPEQPFSDVSKLAKGPDGTTGFLRARTIKPFGFSAEVAEFVPSFLPSDPPPGPGVVTFIR